MDRRYAFANLDDVNTFHRMLMPLILTLAQISWGTKQDTEIETDLGAVVQNSQSQVDLEVLADISDVNGIYEEAIDNLKNRKPVVKNTGPSLAEKDQLAKDYYANVRTNVSSLGLDM